MLLLLATKDLPMVSLAASPNTVARTKKRVKLILSGGSVSFLVVQHDQPLRNQEKRRRDVVVTESMEIQMLSVERVRSLGVQYSPFLLNQERRRNDAGVIGSMVT